MRAYLAFSAHGIDEEWKLVKCIIGIKRLLGSHTNDSIYREFVEITKEFGIEAQLYKIITDGGSNMVKAFDETHLEEYCSLFDELMADTELEVSQENIEDVEEIEEVSEEEINKIIEEIDLDEIAKSVCRSNA